MSGYSLSLLAAASYVNNIWTAAKGEQTRIERVFSYNKLNLYKKVFRAGDWTHTCLNSCVSPRASQGGRNAHRSGLSVHPPFFNFSRLS